MKKATSGFLYVIKMEETGAMCYNPRNHRKVMSEKRQFYNAIFQAKETGYRVRMRKKRSPHLFAPDWSVETFQERNWKRYRLRQWKDKPLNSPFPFNEKKGKRWNRKTIRDPQFWQRELE